MTPLSPNVTKEKGKATKITTTATYLHVDWVNTKDESGSGAYGIEIRIVLFTTI
jgi:hypothetical protein